MGATGAVSPSSRTSAMHELCMRNNHADRADHGLTDWPSRCTFILALTRSDASGTHPHSTRKPRLPTLTEESQPETDASFLTWRCRLGSVSWLLRRKPPICLPVSRRFKKFSGSACVRPVPARPSADIASPKVDTKHTRTRPELRGYPVVFGETRGSMQKNPQKNSSIYVFFSH